MCCANASDQQSMQGLNPTAPQTRLPKAGLHQPGRSGGFPVHKYSLIDMPQNMPFSIPPTFRQFQLPSCMYLKGSQASLTSTLTLPVLRACAPTPKETLENALNLCLFDLSHMKQNYLTWKSTEDCCFNKETCCSLHLLKVRAWRNSVVAVRSSPSGARSPFP